jgi:hypothetical protein
MVKEFNLYEKRKFGIGIEKEQEYIKIAQARINHFSKQKKLGDAK